MTTDSIMAAVSQDAETPYYVYDTGIIRDRTTLLLQTVAGASLYYSLKANPNIGVARIPRQLGTKVEVASIGEIRLAAEAGYLPDETLFIGPGKTPREISEAYDQGITRFVTDTYAELDRISKLTQISEIYLRVNPTFQANGGKLTMSGGRPKQFGVDRDQVAEYVAYARSLGIEVVGLHYYLGTRFLSASDIADNTTLIVRDARQIAMDNSLKVKFLGLGGGFGVNYYANETELNMNDLRILIQRPLAEARLAFPSAELAFESGRFLVAESGFLATDILAVKSSHGHNFAICDGGTNVCMGSVGNIGFGRRNMSHSLIPVGTTAQTSSGKHVVTVTGPLCTPDDIVLKDVVFNTLPQPGDRIILMKVGAYGPSASPHRFLGHQFPEEILI